MIDDTSPAGGGTGKDGDHLDPGEMGAFLEGSLEDAALSRVEAHLAACEECRAEAIAVRRLMAGDNGGGRARTRTMLYWVVPAAAAAAVSAILLVRPGSGPGGGPEGPVLRGDDPGIATIETISPATTLAAPDSVVFVWRALGEGVTYQVTVMDEAGDVLWQNAAEDTTVTLPDSVALRPGMRYYWYVDGLLERARTATSAVQELTISR